jgi:hypothetical protein
MMIEGEAGLIAEPNMTPAMEIPSLMLPGPLQSSLAVRVPQDDALNWPPATNPAFPEMVPDGLCGDSPESWYGGCCPGGCLRPIP